MTTTTRKHETSGKRDLKDRSCWDQASLIAFRTLILVLLSVSGAAAQASEVHEQVEAPTASWTELLDGADAVCEVWVVSVHEDKEFLGTGKLSFDVPITSTLVTRSSLEGPCPERFVLHWSFPATPELGRYGNLLVLFLRRTGSGDSSRWELFDGAVGSWAVESRLSGYRIASESLEFISPEALERVTDLPPELFSDEHLEFRFGRQHLLELQSRVVSIRSLERWFAERRAGREAQ